MRRYKCDGCGGNQFTGGDLSGAKCIYCNGEKLVLKDDLEDDNEFVSGKKEPVRMYDTLKNVNVMLWKNDDMMSQDTLFELQHLFGNILLSVAIDEDKLDDLESSFPWLYERGV